MPNLLAIDPSGDPKGHTGIVRFEYGDDTPARATQTWAIPGGVKALHEWWEADSPVRGIVVCEEFVNRNIPGADLSPLRVQGAIEWLSIDQGFTLALQPAAGKNTAVTDEVLTRFGLYDFPGDHHHDRREAARHGLMFLKKHKHMPTIRAMYPQYAEA